MSGLILRNQVAPAIAEAALVVPGQLFPWSLRFLTLSLNKMSLLGAEARKWREFLMVSQAPQPLLHLKVLHS